VGAAEVRSAPTAPQLHGFTRHQAALQAATLLLPGQQQSPLLPAKDLKSGIAEKASDLKMISILVSSQWALS